MVRLPLKKQRMLHDKRIILLSLARTAISETLGQPLKDFVPHDAGWLKEKAACFVTLKTHGSLRGCVGTLEARRSLFEDIHGNAIAAALHDPRFPPMTMDELAIITIEVSLLSSVCKLNVHSEEETITKLRPGLDGVVLRFGHKKATFLPQVWEQLPDGHQFLAQLRLKAGLAPDFWDPGVLVYIYQVDKFSEAGVE